MPKPDKVIKAFQFPESQFGDFKVIDYNMGHIEQIKYRLYEYPFEYHFRGRGDVQALQKKFKRGDKTVVYTSYGNPYLCEITQSRVFREGNDVYVVGKLICKRDFSLPKR